MTPDRPDNNSKLEDVLRRQEEALARELGQRRSWRSDPERLQPLGVIRGLLGEVRRLHVIRRGAAGGGDDSADYYFAEFLDRDLSSLGTRAAWEFADNLERLLVETGDRYYIHARLAREARRAADRSGYDSWNDLFAEDKLKALLAGYEAGEVTEASPVHRQAVEFLVALHASRGGGGRHRVTVSNLKRLYLNRLACVMAVLLVLLLQAIYLTGKGAGSFSLRHVWMFFRGELGFDFTQEVLRHASIAGVMGALGSVLSALIKLRDQRSRIDDLRTFGSMMLAQPLVGAAAGLFLFAVLQSRLLGIQIADGALAWAVFGVFGLAAGFSEPFLLNVVGRVVGAADKAEERGAGEKKEEKPAGAGGASGGRTNSVADNQTNKPKDKQTETNADTQTKPPAPGAGGGGQPSGNKPAANRPGGANPSGGHQPAADQPAGTTPR